METDKKVTAESYTLKTPTGQWLGQITMTSDGMISGMTDWGVFVVTWRSFGDNFKKFIIGIDQHYFGTKIYGAMNVMMPPNRKFEQSCMRVSEKILPELQKVLKEEFAS